MSDTRNWTPNLKSRIGIAVVELALVGVAWYVLKLDDLLAGAIAAVLLLGNPPGSGAGSAGDVRVAAAGLRVQGDRFARADEVDAHRAR